jgi:glycosyltransferase involved in cell wall biosynthesis
MGNFSIIGFVPNLPEAIHGSIMIVPILSGSGMRMKIIEAMALSMPIITTSVGVEGIKLIDKESCLIADEPKDFAEAINYLVSHPEICQSLGERANNVFRQYYSIEVLSGIRNKVYSQFFLQ